MVGNIAHSQSKHSLQIETSQPSKLTWNAPSVHLSVQLCLSLLSFFSLPLSPVPPSLLTLIFSPRSSFVYRFWIPFCAHPSFMLMGIDPHQLYQTSHCLQWPDINKTLFRRTGACHSALCDAQMNPPPNGSVPPPAMVYCLCMKNCPSFLINCQRLEMLLRQWLSRASDKCNENISWQYLCLLCSENDPL